MGRFQDLTGKRFGRLRVLHRAPEPDRHGNIRWECVCDCGMSRTVHGCSLRAGQTKSCGCLLRSVARMLLTERTRHGVARRGNSRPPEYTAWQSMKERCSNPNRADFRNYGGRGIRVCEAWTGRDGFRRFLEHVGPRPDTSHSLDRINPNGHYEPGNVRWASSHVQSKNRRPQRSIEWNGQEITVSRLARALEIPSGRVLEALERLGWPPVIVPG
jgi:hypothetical protein